MKYEIHFAMYSKDNKGIAPFGRIKTEKTYKEWKEAQKRLNTLNQDNTKAGYDGWYYLQSIGEQI